MDEIWFSKVSYFLLTSLESGSVWRWLCIFFSPSVLFICCSCSYQKSHTFSFVGFTLGLVLIRAFIYNYSACTLNFMLKTFWLRCVCLCVFQWSHSCSSPAHFGYSAFWGSLYIDMASLRITYLATVLEHLSTWVHIKVNHFNCRVFYLSYYNGLCIMYVVVLLFQTSITGTVVSEYE